MKLIHASNFIIPVFSLFLSCKPALENQAKAPNILFFFIDDQRNTTLGCYGDTIVQTPVVDKLAEQGTRFGNAFVTTSICMASRATIFTGLVTRTHGVPSYQSELAKKFEPDVYPIRLKEAGYQVGFIGKFGFKVNKDVDEAAWFDFYKPFDQPLMKTMPDGTKKHETELAGEYAMEFINNLDPNKPFCLQVSFNAAHAVDKDLIPGTGHFPWMPELDGLYENIMMPEPRLGDNAIFDNMPQFLKESLNRTRYFWRWDTPEKYQINMRAYYRLISGIDLTIGRVQNLLKEKGLDNNTIVIYMADNGYYMGDRGFAGKWSHFEESLRVPLIIYDPGLPQNKRGAVLNQLVVNTDIPSTILDYAGVGIPSSYQGGSLKQLIEGEAEEWRDLVFCESLHQAPFIPKWEGLHDGRYVYARYFTQEPVYEFLHDLKADPDQLMNFVENPEYKEILEKKRKKCDELVQKYEMDGKN